MILQNWQTSCVFPDKKPYIRRFSCFLCSVGTLIHVFVFEGLYYITHLATRFLKMTSGVIAKGTQIYKFKVIHLISYTIQVVLLLNLVVRETHCYTSHFMLEALTLKITFRNFQIPDPSPAHRKLIQPELPLLAGQNKRTDVPTFIKPLGYKYL